VKKPPEVVPRVREVVAGRSGDAAGIDAAEENPQPRREHVRQSGLRTWRWDNARAHGSEG
jgi:hypothetical protein